MKLTGAILAGGQGSRLGGVDKGLCALDGRPLAAWVVERLAPQVTDLLIVANRNLDDYRALHHPVVQDLRAGFLGPLAGVETALAAMRHSWMVTCPVDAPLLPSDYVQRMVTAARGHPAVARLEGHLQPVYTLLPRQALPGLRAFLTAGGRKASLWLESLNAVPVDFDDCADAFADADTHVELKALQERLGTSDQGVTPGTPPAGKERQPGSR